MKIALCLSLFLLTACSPSSQQDANREAEKVKEDVRRGVDKVKDSPATKELADDAKRGFHKADAVVTEELEKGREKVRQGAQDLKKKADNNP